MLPNWAYLALTRACLDRSRNLREFVEAQWEIASGLEDPEAMDNSLVDEAMEYQLNRATGPMKLSDESAWHILLGLFCGNASLEQVVGRIKRSSPEMI